MSTASKAELADSTRSNTRQCFRVAVEDTVVIPANSELITAAKVLDECGNGGVGILEPTTEFVRRSKLLVGRSLVQMEGTIPIRLLNPTPYPRLVYRNTLVLCEAVDGLQEVPQKVDTNVRLARDSQDENRIQNEPLPPELEELFARGHLRVASQRQKRLYDHKSHTNSYREGEKVWLYNPQKRKGRGPKLETPWEGPWMVTKQVTDVVYCIQRNPKEKSNFVDHDRLKPFQE